MITADILMWFLLIVGLLIVFNSYWLASVALFPGMVDRACAAYARPIKSLLVGLAAAVPIVIVGVAVASSKNPVAKILGIAITVVPVLVGLLGSTGLSQRIGAGMASPVDQIQPWRRVLRGGIVLSLVFLLPILGWLGVLPLTLLSGFGAAILALKKTSRTAAANVAAAKAEVAFPEVKEMAQ